LTERMIGEDEVTMSQFQRYAAIFRDPAMAQALERYIPEINKTQRNTVERFKVLKRMYDEILPPEVIRAYERSLEGIKETYYTAFMNPETGLFGIGRKLTGVARNMNQFGQYVKTLEDGSQKVLTEAEIAAGKFEMVDMSVFDLFRDILANVGVVLGPIVNNLTLLFDPMKNVANALTAAREATAKFLYSFEYYRQGLIDFSKNLSKQDKVDFAKIDINFRASLAAINNLYKQLGVISGAEFLDNAKQLESIKFDAAAMLKGFIDKFMDSKIASQIGNTVGVVVGTVITQMANMVSMFAGLAKPNKLVQGFMDGFTQAKGPEAVQDIIKGVFQIITKALIEVFKLAPAQFTALGGIVLLLPAFISGVSVAIGTFVETALDLSLGRLASRLKGKAPKEVLDKVDDVLKPGGPIPTRARPGSGGMIFDPYIPEAPPPPKPTRAQRFKGFAKSALGVGGEIESVFGKSFIEFLKKFQNFFSKVGPSLTKATAVLKGSSVGISAGLSGLIVLLKKLDNFFLDVIEGKVNILDDAISGAKNLGARGLGALKGAGAGAKNLGALAKGLPVRIMSVAKAVTGGAKAAAGGFGGLLTKGTKMLGKGGGILTAGVGIIEAITSLLSGDSLGTAIGKGAGPVLGTIIGTALLGPIGGIIGGMIGSMEEITGPLGDAADAIMGTLGTTFEFLGQVGGDLLGMINGLVGLLPGVSEGFNILEFALFALLSPFKLLEIAISGIYDLYLSAKKLFAGLSEEEQKRLDERRTQKLTDEFTILGRLRSGFSLEQQKREEYAKWLAAKTKNDKEAMNRSAEYMKSIEKLLKDRGGADKTKEKAAQPEPKKPTTPAKAATPKPVPVPEPAKPSFDWNKFWSEEGTKWAEGAKKFMEEVRKLPEHIGFAAGYVSTKISEAARNLDLAWSSFTASLERNWNSFLSWLRSSPAKLRSAISQAINGLQSAWQQFTRWFTGLGPKMQGATSNALTSLQNGTSQIISAVVNWAKSLPQRIVQGFVSGQQAAKTPVGSRWDPKAKKTVIVYSDGSTSAAAEAFGSGNAFRGSLAKAVSFEQKNKPPGSDLVVANTSETVIPAAGGYGMSDFIETMRAGFGVMVSAFKESQQKQDNTLRSIRDTLVSNQMQTNARLQKLETKFTTPGMAGGLGGAGAGGVDAFTPIAQRMGLTMTSGYRPGDPGWHGANRARDFSNGTGPTPQMMQFAQYLATTYGQNLKELIYTPLGFSIKNGQRVAPYAQGSHYNHVHVAYALGPNNGRMFTSLDAAQSWENSMVPGSVKVASITGNSGERLGETNIVNNMTITQQPGEDGEALANRVATLFFDAVKNAQSSSIFA
jgi:hypothetical protein